MQNLQKKFLKFIVSNYSKSQFYKLFEDDFIKITNKAFSHENIFDLNVEYIKWILNILKINTKVYHSSSLNIKIKKYRKIIDICNYFKANSYITTAGSKSYLSGNEYFFKENKIELIYHNYKHPSYTQLFEPYSEYACILDLIFNEGYKSLSIIKSGRIVD